jgi:hypothetical protein
MLSVMMPQNKRHGGTSLPRLSTTNVQLSKTHRRSWRGHQSYQSPALAANLFSFSGVAVWCVMLGGGDAKHNERQNIACILVLNAGETHEEIIEWPKRRRSVTTLQQVKEEEVKEMKGCHQAC